MLFVGNVDLDVFVSHELKNLMAEFGPIDSIRYLKGKDSAFVRYVMLLFRCSDANEL